MKPSDNAQYHEDTHKNNKVLRVVRADGSMFFTAAEKYVVEENGALCISRRFYVEYPPASLIAKAAAEWSPLSGTPNPKWAVMTRTLAPGAWIEIEEVTDRIRPVEAREFESGDPREPFPRHRFPHPVVRTPEGEPE